MSDVYDLRDGTTPLLISIPHSGTALPDSIAGRLSTRAKTLPDTDWHVPLLYNFAIGLGAWILQASYSRFVVDLNRPPDNENLYPGQPTTGLCPNILFDGEHIYADGKPVPDAEVAYRREQYWQPYHDKLSETLAVIRAEYGHAILYDAHSIASRVPRLFDGLLPDLNLGTANGESCHTSTEQALRKVLEASDFSSVVNGRFVGGYITRHYGSPAEDIQAVQMEIAQSAYMDEGPGFLINQQKAERLRRTLHEVLRVCLGAVCKN